MWAKTEKRELIMAYVSYQSQGGQDKCKGGSAPLICPWGNLAFAPPPLPSFKGPYSTGFVILRKFHIEVTHIVSTIATQGNTSHNPIHNDTPSRTTYPHTHHIPHISLTHNDTASRTLPSHPTSFTHIDTPSRTPPSHTHPQ